MKHYKDVAEEALRRRDEYDVQRNQRKQMLRRKMITTLAALAIFVTVAGSITLAVGYISGAEWFTNYFQGRSEKKFTENQQDIIAERVLDVNQSVTADDITITMKSVFFNLSDVYLNFSIETTRDISLEACFPQAMLKGVDGTIYTSGWTLSSSEYDAENNIMHYVVFMTLQGNNDVQRKKIMQDGNLRIILSELKRTEFIKEPELKRVVIPISDEKWEFDITFDEISEIYHPLMSEPVTCKTQHFHFKDRIVELEVQALNGYAMAVRGEYSIISDSEWDIPPEIAIVMLDGVEIKYSSAKSGRKLGVSKVSVIEFGFETPINWDEVDYIRVGGYENEKGKWVGAAIVDVN